jgi:hypothetical protein
MSADASVLWELAGSNRHQTFVILRVKVGVSDGEREFNRLSTVGLL